MRWPRARTFYAGLFAVLWAVPAFGGVTARIISVGFGSFVRADDWVPLVVQTTSDEPAPHTYDLQVVQSDLDGDDVVYARTGLTVNPGTQSFRTYFRPESVGGGLPASGTDSAGDLGKRLRVYLFDPATGKRAVRVAVAGSQPQAMETGTLAGGQGQKLILVVGRSPNLRDFVPGSGRVLGLGEQAYFVQVDPNRLPESALAYGAIDAIVWTDADTARLAPAQVAAVRQYVQGGGTLAVLQNADPARLEKFSDLLPVRAGESTEWASAEPLRSILLPANAPPPLDAGLRPLDPFRHARPPYRLAVGPATPDAIVDAWATAPDGARTPYIARRLVGVGCVAWIAQDLSDPSIATIDFGWPHVWEKLLDWRDTGLVLTAAESPASLDRAKASFAADTPRDLGASFLSGTNLEKKTAQLITLAFVFFVTYWALAGPVSFLVLSSRKQAQYSWFAYAAIATAALVLTALIAQLVLRGGAEVRHLSLVRTRGDGSGEARVLSRFGVYLPKDATVPVALTRTPAGGAADRSATPPVGLTPLALDPKYAPENVSRVTRRTSCRWTPRTPPPRPARRPRRPSRCRSARRSKSCRPTGPARSPVASTGRPRSATTRRSPGDCPTTPAANSATSCSSSATPCSAAATAC